MASIYDPLRMNVRKLKPGQAYIATQGEDFDCAPTSFQHVVYGLAQKAGNGWKATTTVVGQNVIYAFYKGSDFMRPNLAAYPVVKKWKGEE